MADTARRREIREVKEKCPPTPQHQRVNLIDITLTGEKLEIFPLRSKIRQGYQLSPLLFNITPEVLANGTTTRKGNKKYRDHEGRNKIVFADDLSM